VQLNNADEIGRCEPLCLSDSDVGAVSPFAQNRSKSARVCTHCINFEPYMSEQKSDISSTVFVIIWLVIWNCKLDLVYV